MLKYRHILQSASFLLAGLALGGVPALAPAQTPNTNTTQNPKPPVQTDTVLFDFENGAYDGWTLTGDCWDTHPATVKTFIDRQGNPLVTGIVGNGYLTTLYQSAATTGQSNLERLHD